METNQKRCPYCRAWIDEDVVKCRHCGEYVVNNPKIPGTDTTPATIQHGPEEYGRTAEQRVHPVTGEPMQPRPKNRLVEAILVTIFCCQIFGIIGIVFAAQVDSTYNRGNIRDSYDLSRKASTWINVSLICGLSVGVIYILYFVIVGTAALSL